MFVSKTNEIGQIDHALLLSPASTERISSGERQAASQFSAATGMRKGGPMARLHF